MKEINKKNKKVTSLIQELNDLLSEFKIYDKSGVTLEDIDSFLFLESRLGEVFERYRFKIDFLSTFIENCQVPVTKLVEFDNAPSFNRPLIVRFLDRLHRQRDLIIRLIRNLNERGNAIFSIKRNREFTCFLTNAPECVKDIKEKPGQVFIAYDFKDTEMKRVMKYIREILTSQNFNPIDAGDKRVTHDFMCKICQMIQESDFIIGEISNQNTSVGLEIGLALGLQKKAILIANKNVPETADLKRTDSIRYDDNLGVLKKDLEAMLENIID